jgi:CHAT domain
LLGQALGAPSDGKHCSRSVIGELQGPSLRGLARPSSCCLAKAKTGDWLSAFSLQYLPPWASIWACETGLYDIARNPDEFIGLPATFMQIGATRLLASLWQVDDLATALLMARFYDLQLGEGPAPPGLAPPCCP